MALTGYWYDPNKTNTYYTDPNTGKTREVSSSEMRAGQVVPTTTGGQVVWGADGKYSPYYSFEAPDYSEYFGIMNENLDAQKELADKEIAIAERQMELAEQQLDFYKTNFLPIIKDQIELAKTGIDPEYSADIAGESVSAGMQASAGAADREMRRLGVSDQSGLYSGIDDSMERSEKLAVVDARNQARVKTNETNDQMKYEVAAMGAGVPATGFNALSQSANTLADASATQAMGAGGVASVASSQASADLAGTLSANQAMFDQSQFEATTAQNQSIAEAQMLGAMLGAAGTLGGAMIGYGMSSPVPSQPAPTQAYPGQPAGAPYAPPSYSRSGYVAPPSYPSPSSSRSGPLAA